MAHFNDTIKWLGTLKLQHQKHGKFHKHNIPSFIRQMPKVELHAHLNGCIRESTLLQLANERSVKLSSLLHDLQTEYNVTAEEKYTKMDMEEKKSQVNRKRRSLNECFEIFGEITNCVTDLGALRRITREACEDFSNDGVAYLELRSTPKVLYLEANTSASADDRSASEISCSRKCTKREYVETILDVLKDFEEVESKRYDRETKETTSPNVVRLPMKVRFILSVNRADSVADAMEHAQLAIDMAQEANQYVIGMDLSGNPMKNTFKELEPSFQLARNAGLKVSIHCGEIPCNSGAEDENEDSGDYGNKEDAMVRFGFEDTNDILSFKPDRLGHALLLTNKMYDDLETKCLEQRIPIECCPTSNVMTLELATHYEGDLVHGLRKHPRLKHWLDSDYPISINTDDPGIFNTDPVTELTLLVEAFQMKDPLRIVSMMVTSIDHTFESNAFKAELKAAMMQQISMILALHPSI